MNDRLLPILHVMGLLLVCFGVTYLMPIMTSFIYHDDAMNAFIDAMGICILVGIGLWWPARRFKRELHPRDGFLLVTLAWVLMAASEKPWPA